jgi:hypothetical protein
MHRVTSQTRRRLSMQNHIARVSEYVTVARVESFIVSPRPVDLQILKQVVARYEIVRVRKPGTSRHAPAQMTLRANRCDNPRVVFPLLRQQYHRSVVRVFEIHVSVTGVTVKPEGRELSRLRVYCRSVTPGASGGEFLFVPRGPLSIYELFYFAISERGLNRKNRKATVTFLFQKSNAMATPHEIFHLCRHGFESRLTFDEASEFRRVFALSNGHSVSVLLPRLAYVVAMTEKALVSVNVFGQRLAHVIRSPRGRVRLLLLTDSRQRDGGENDNEDRQELDFFERKEIEILRLSHQRACCHKSKWAAT